MWDLLVPVNLHTLAHRSPLTRLAPSVLHSIPWQPSPRLGPEIPSYPTCPSEPQPNTSEMAFLFHGIVSPFTRRSLLLRVVVAWNRREAMTKKGARPIIGAAVPFNENVFVTNRNDAPLAASCIFDTLRFPKYGQAI